MVHVDAYRLTGPDDLEPLGWDRFIDPVTRMGAGNAAVVVEWAGRIAPALPVPDDLCEDSRSAMMGESARS